MAGEHLGRKLIGIAVGAALSALGQGAWAGAFGIGTQSGSGTGNAYSGGGAAADDAGALWFNPALMSVLPAGRHVSFALHAVKPYFKFHDDGSTIPPALGSGDGGDGGSWAAIPNGAFVMSVNDKLSFGVAVNAPFGLKTEYDVGWIGQRIGITSEIKSVNVNPALSYRVTPQLSIGAGLNVQWLKADLDNASALGTSHLTAEDVGFGFNLGLALQATPSTRVGAAYRSSIDYKLDGSAGFSGFPLANVGAEADLRTPESASLSVFSVLSPKWEVMADVTWTRWSRIPAIVPTCQAVSPVVCTGGGGTPILGATLPTNWKDTWRIGIGANYIYDERWKMRMGIAYDPTPTNDADRTARLPDESRLWVAFGAQYKVSKQGKMEFGYAHEFGREANVDTRVFGTQFRQTGRFDVRADILTFAYSHTF